MKVKQILMFIKGEFGPDLNSYKLNETWDRILKEICTRGKAYKNRKDWIAARMNQFLCKQIAAFISVRTFLVPL